MLYKTPSEHKMHYSSDLECYFDYVIVEDDENVNGYFPTMQEALSPKETKQKRKPRVINELD